MIVFQHLFIFFHIALNEDNTILLGITVCIIFLSVSYLSESVKEGFGQSLTSTALSEGVLASKYLGLLLLNLEAHSQFWYEDLCSMIKAGIKTLQHRLRRQVELGERGTSQFNIANFISTIR